MAKKKEKRTKAVKKIPVKKTVKVDKWKIKQEYIVKAPKLFEEKEMSVIYANDEKNLYNRVIRFPYSTLTNKFDQYALYTTLKLRIVEVKGKTALTRYIGSFITPGFLKTLARRKRSVINEFKDITTKDNDQIRVKTTIITARRVSTSAKREIRNIIGTFLSNRAKESNTNEFVGYILANKIERDVRKDLQKIAPIKKVLVHKSEVKKTVV